MVLSSADKNHETPLLPAQDPEPFIKRTGFFFFLFFLSLPFEYLYLKKYYWWGFDFALFIMLCEINRVCADR